MWSISHNSEWSVYIGHWNNPEMNTPETCTVGYFSFCTKTRHSIVHGTSIHGGLTSIKTIHTTAQSPWFLSMWHNAQKPEKLSGRMLSFGTQTEMFDNHSPEYTVYQKTFARMYYSPESTISQKIFPCQLCSINSWRNNPESKDGLTIVDYYPYSHLQKH